MTMLFVPIQMEGLNANVRMGTQEMGQISVQVYSETFAGNHFAFNG